MSNFHKPCWVVLQKALKLTNSQALNPERQTADRQTDRYNQCITLNKHNTCLNTQSITQV